MTDLHLLADGPPGASGARGAGGHRSRQPGTSGGPGHDAGPAQPGQAGGEVELHLAEVDGIVRASGFVRFASGELRPFDSRVPLHDLGWIHTSARGGAGGDGGTGGTGGTGAVGWNGRDENFTAPAELGRPGGQGGIGGRGSHGAFGGHGGAIRIHVHERDAWLLTAVSDAHDPAPLTAGGPGGRPGAHGAGGQGGTGGLSGFPKSLDRVRGPTGPIGPVPQTPLYAGRPGRGGVFEIHVHRPDRIDTYPARFVLEVVGFELDDADGRYELGQVVEVSRIRVRNVGGMPTVPGQRLCVTLAEGPSIASDDALVVDRSIAPGEEHELEGTLRLTLLRPSDASVEPWVTTATVVPIVTQLGPPGAFARRCDRPGVTRSLTVRFPVHNAGGIACLRSLAPGERTLVSFDVTNDEAYAVGRDASGGRRVGVQVELLDGELGEDDVSFVDAEGNAQPRLERFAGWFCELARVEPHSTVHVRGQLGTPASAEPFAAAVVRVTLWITDLREPDCWVVVQRRVATIRIEPPYRPDPAARVLLVTHDGVSRAAYLAWRALLCDTLGLSFVTWSLSRYGHFDPDAVLDDGSTLEEAIADRLVIVLDQWFHPRHDAVPRRPSRYVEASRLRRSAIELGTRWVVVGAPDAFSIQRALEPVAPMDLRDDHRNAESLLRAETLTLDPAVAATLRPDVCKRFDRVALTTNPMLATVIGTPADLAFDLLRELARIHPDRRYVLVVDPHDRPRQVDAVLGMLPCWELGTAEVRRSLDLDAPSLVHVQVADSRATDPRFIGSEAVLYAVLTALPFAEKLGHLGDLLRRDAAHADSAGATVKSIVAELSREQWLLFAREAEIPIDLALAKLHALVHLPMGTLVPASTAMWPALFDLVACLEALCRARGTSLRLWGHVARAREAVEQQVELLRASLLDGNPPGDAAAAIESRIDRILAAARASAGNNDTVVRALHVLLEQRPTGVLVDVDLWCEPAPRIWTRQQLDQRVAAEAERTRTAHAGSTSTTSGL